MKMKSLKIASALVLGVLVLGTTLYAQGTDSRIGSIKRERVEHGETPAPAITKERAEKNYPIGGGSYPPGPRDAHDPSGVIVSPYPPHEKYECSQVAHGGLVVDGKVNKVFVRP